MIKKFLINFWNNALKPIPEKEEDCSYSYILEE